MFLRESSSVKLLQQTRATAEDVALLAIGDRPLPRYNHGRVRMVYPHDAHHIVDFHWKRLVHAIKTEQTNREKSRDPRGVIKAADYLKTNKQVSERFLMQETNWRSKPCANFASAGMCRYGDKCCFWHSSFSRGLTVPRTV